MASDAIKSIEKDVESGNKDKQVGDKKLTKYGLLERIEADEIIEGKKSKHPLVVRVGMSKRRF
jgi:hypothetical protein